jgi:two-component system chemotaxis response regulator CheY
MKKTVIAVDDSKIMRDMLTFVLQRAGYNVLPAENGADALDLLKQRAADCVVTDLTMPVMDGLQLIKSMQAGPHKSVPVVMMACMNEDLKRQQGRSAGASGWVDKPFNPERLVMAVGKACA